MIELLSDPSAWLSFATLTALEIVLGVDNVIFLALLVARLPPERQHAARVGGLALAMLTRVALLFSIVFLTTLTRPLLELAGHGFSGRDLVLGGGGLFLLWKSVMELHSAVEGDAGPDGAAPRLPRGGLPAVMLQIALLDIVFSFDSVLTAVGLAQRREVMVAAIVVAIICMMFLARGIGDYIARHPTLKVLALAFLMLIGVTLIAESVAFHIPKGYLYFSMAFALAIELLNTRRRRTTGAARGRKD